MSSLLLAFSSFAWFDRPWLCCHWAEPNICHLIAHNLTILLPLLPSYSPKLPSYSPKLSSYSPKLPSFSPKLSSYSPKLPSYSPLLPSYSPLLSSNSPLSPSDDCPPLLHISWSLPLPLYSTATTNYSLTGYRREWQLQPIETDKAVAKNMDAAVNNFHINYLSQWETMACHFFFSLDHLTANVADEHPLQDCIELRTCPKCRCAWFATLKISACIAYIDFWTAALTTYF